MEELIVLSLIIMYLQDFSVIRHEDFTMKGIRTDLLLTKEYIKL